jgi:hypothetical protein
MIADRFPHIGVATAGVDGVGWPSTRTGRARRTPNTSAVAACRADRGKSVVMIAVRGRGQRHAATVRLL